MTHTQDPWVVGEIGARGEGINIERKTHGVIAVVYNDFSGYGANSETEELDTARLIAAAPELLEACKLALQNEINSGPYNNKVLVSTLEEVITKATGGNE